MRRSSYWVVIVSGVMGAAVVVAQQSPPSAATDAAKENGATSEHVTLAPDQLKWGAPPPGLPQGGEMAVLSGDPSKPGLFTIRFKSSGAFTVPAHWHSHDEHI